MRLKLTQGRYALIDKKDFDLIKNTKWCVDHPTRRQCYAVATINCRNVRLHRVILGIVDHKDLHVDHINGNGLDNRRKNLRICNQSQNNMNQRVQKRKKSSRFKGVTWDKNRSKWMAKIKMNGRHFNLGRFSVEEEAAMAYNKKAEVIFGEFARLNDV